jgi:large subunit ribosomal protein L23
MSVKTPVLVPRISEKAIALAEKGVYVFDVPTDTNKIEVAKAVAQAFNVEVVAVNIIVAKGKVKRFKQKLGQEKDVKKALVTVKKGQSIKLFEGSK